jgi:hypothetical protein
MSDFTEDEVDCLKKMIYKFRQEEILELYNKRQHEEAMVHRTTVSGCLPPPKRVIEKDVQFKSFLVKAKDTITNFFLKIQHVNIQILVKGLQYREECHQRDFVKNEIKRRKREISKAIFVIIMMFLSVIVMGINFNCLATAVSCGTFVSILLYLLYKA